MLPNNKLKKIKKNNKENVAKDKFREKFLNYLKEKGDYDEYNKIVEEFGDITDKKPKKINKPDEFIDDEYMYALDLDSLESSHPIEFNELYICLSEREPPPNPHPNTIIIFPILQYVESIYLIIKSFLYI